MRFKKTLAATLALGTLSGIALAHGEHGFSKYIDYRTSIMQIFKWNIGPMGAMVKGKIPYDQKAFAAHAKDLAAAAGLDLEAGFPEDSDEGETDARADIWMDWEDFVQKHGDLKSESAKLAEVAAGDDEAATRAQFGEMAKTCKACHKKYKD